MRTFRVALVLAVMGGVVSCAGDMPVAPRANIEITGVVLDRDGGPLSGAYIYFLVDPEPSDPPFYHLRTQTASDGTFRGKVPEGNYRVAISPRLQQGLADVEVPFTVSESSTHFEHRYSGVLVSGTGVGPGGVPVAGFSVYAHRTDYSEFISTQAVGNSYEFLLRPGAYQFEASAGTGNGLPSLSFEVNVPDRDTTLHLDFGGHEIRIQTTLFGAGIPRTSVTASKPGISNYEDTDLRGEAVLYLPSGTYDFRVHTNTQGITMPEHRSLSIQGPATIPFDLSGARWTGTVRRIADQGPVAHAPVFVQEVGTDRRGSTWTNASGTFEMIVRPGILHNLWIQPGSGGTFFVNGIASSADSTFDIPINVPVP